MLRALALLLAVFAVTPSSGCGQDAAPAAPVQLEVVRSLALPAGVVNAAAFSPSGGWLCSGGEAGDVIVWDVRMGAQRWRAQPSDRRIVAVAWPFAGDRVAVLGRDLTVHDVRDGREVMRAAAWSEDAPWSDNPGALAYSPDGQQLAFQRSRGAVRVLALPAGEVIADFADLGVPVYCLAFARDGASLFAGDQIARVWQLSLADRTDREVYKHGGRTAVYPCKAVACCGGELLSIGQHGDILLGDRMLRHDGHVVAAAVGPDGETFAAVGKDGRVTIWQDRGVREHTIETGANVAALAIHPDGNTVAVATRDGSLRLIGGRGAPRELAGHVAVPTSLAWSPDGTVLAIGGERRTMFARRDDTRILAAGTVLGGRIGDEILVRQQSRIVARSGITGAELEAWPCAKGANVLALLPDRSALVVQPDRERASLERLDLTTGQTTAMLGALGVIVDVAWSSTGAFALGTKEGVQLWSAAGHCPFDDGSRGGVGTVAFALDGTRFVYASRKAGVHDGAPSTLCVRDGATGQLLREVDSGALWFRFFDDHTAIAHDGAALSLWDTGRWEQVATLPLMPICRASLAPDRSQVAVATNADVRVVRIRAANR